MSEPLPADNTVPGTLLSTIVHGDMVTDTETADTATINVIVESRGTRLGHECLRTDSGT